MTFEKFRRLESSEEAIDIVRDIFWTRTTKQDEYRISKQVCVVYEGIVMSAQNLEVSIKKNWEE